MRLLDSTKLAKELGVSRWIPKASKVAGKYWGDSPFVGRSTLPKFLAWMDRHPTFVANLWLRSHADDHLKGP